MTKQFEPTPQGFSDMENAILHSGRASRMPTLATRLGKPGKKKKNGGPGGPQGPQGLVDRTMQNMSSELERGGLFVTSSKSRIRSFILGALPL